MGWWGLGGCIHAMYGRRSRIVMDPRIAIMPRRSTSVGTGGGGRGVDAPW